jgi:hypothetical protein
MDRIFTTAGFFLLLRLPGIGPGSGCSKNRLKKTKFS